MKIDYNQYEDFDCDLLDFDCDFDCDFDRDLLDCDCDLGRNGN